MLYIQRDEGSVDNTEKDVGRKLNLLEIHLSASSDLLWKISRMLPDRSADCKVDVREDKDIFNFISINNKAGIPMEKFWVIGVLYLSLMAS